MEYLITITLTAMSFLFGMTFYKEVNKYLTKKELELKKLKIKNIFNEVSHSIKSENSRFKSRFLQTSYINTVTPTMGIIDIIYLMDKNDIAILKDNKVEYTSDGVDRELIDEIILLILRKHNNEINDVVNVFGLLFSKKDFESNFKMKVEDFNKIMYKLNNEKFGPGVDSIIKNNQDSFDIDEILDKIGKYGMGSLTEEEKKYLNDYSNGAG